MSVQLIVGSAPEVLSTLREGSIPLVITSPPYKEKDGFTYELMEATFAQLFRVQTKNGLFFLNFGHLAEEKMRPFRVCEVALKHGYQLNETFTWVKNHFKPIQGSKRVNNLTEFVFLLYKGKMPVLNRLAIGVPYIDISNAKRFNRGLNLRCRGNLWEIPYQTINNSSEKSHPDRFPVQLAEFCIQLSGFPKRSMVLDPFIGSGTTAVATQNYAMNCIGIDVNDHWIDYSKSRLLLAENRQMEMFQAVA